MTDSKIALITGGSRGLGKNMALNLAKKGLDVIITYNSKKEDADDVVNQIKSTGQNAAALQLDVSAIKSLDSFLENLRRVLQEVFHAEKFDFLVNNAGTGLHKPFIEVSEDEFESLMNIHLKSVFFLTQKALPIMNDGGCIVNISTGLARITLPGSSAYATMKGAVEILTKYMAKELGERRIRANVVAPGAIETDFRGGAVRDNKEMNKYIASQTALGRVGLPEDIGGVVAFLCSDDARWITAQRIEVSGGQSL